MKVKKIILSLALAIVTTLNLSAQKKEGHVKYDIEFSTSNAEMESALSMMAGSTLELFFKDDDTKTEMKMGAFMNITTITNSKTKEMLMLLGGMMGNKAINTNFSELEELNGEQPKIDVEFMDETKVIKGYTCKKAVLTDENDVEAIYWYTEEISINKTGHNYLSEKVPGFPLEFEMNQGEMKMHMTVTNFEEKIGKKSKELFNTAIPEGYEVMTMEELTQLGI